MKAERLFFIAVIYSMHAVKGRGVWGTQQVSLASLQPRQRWLDMPANGALPLNTNQIGNVRPDIPPSQNNCVDQTERSKSTMHCFHEREGRGGGSGGGRREIQTEYRSPRRRTKLVELEHLQNREIPRFSRPARPEGSLSTGRERRQRAARCTRQRRHYWAPISTNTPSKSLHGHKMNYCITWLEPVTSPHLTNALLAPWVCTRGSNVNRPPPPHPLSFSLSSHAESR